MIVVQFFKEIHEFCDTTRLLYKWCIHHRKFNTLQILISKFLSKFLLWERRSHAFPPHYTTKITVINGKKYIILFDMKSFNECFPILSPWIKSWSLYNGYSTLEDNQEFIKTFNSNFILI